MTIVLAPPTEIRPFALSDQCMVQHYAQQAQDSGNVPLSCEYSFVNLFCWGDIYQYSWFIHEDRLVVYDGKDGVMFMPLGRPMPPKSLVALSKTARSMGFSPDICLVPEYYPNQFPEITQYYDITPDRAAGEYIYLTTHLCDLKGTKLHKKKNLIAQFTRNHPDHRITSISPDQLSILRRFTMDLLRQMDPVPLSLNEERRAIERAVEHWEDLSLEGLMAWAGDDLVAYAVFSPLGNNAYTVHFEKSNIGVKGAAQYINRETAAYLESRARCINREQDLGIQGLRQAKLSYAPHQVWVPFILKYKL